MFEFPVPYCQPKKNFEDQASAFLKASASRHGAWRHQSSSLIQLSYRSGAHFVASNCGISKQTQPRTSQFPVGLGKYHIFIAITKRSPDLLKSGCLEPLFRRNMSTSDLRLASDGLKKYALNHIKSHATLKHLATIYSLYMSICLILVSISPLISPQKNDGLPSGWYWMAQPLPGRPFLSKKHGKNVGHPAKLAISQPWKLGVQLEKRDFHGIFNGIFSIKRGFSMGFSPSKNMD